MLYVIILIILIIALGLYAYMRKKSGKEGSVSDGGAANKDQFDPKTVIAGGPSSVGGSSDTATADLSEPPHSSPQLGDDTSSVPPVSVAPDQPAFDSSSSTEPSSDTQGEPTVSVSPETSSSSSESAGSSGFSLGSPPESTTSPTEPGSGSPTPEVTPSASPVEGSEESGDGNNPNPSA
ncbi:MAG TPA: hypothetical protein VGF75_07600 [Candidatus Saccharimonadales bacterium]|jgi:hypothetical protein